MSLQVLIHCDIPNTCDMEYASLLQLLHKIMNTYLKSYRFPDVIHMNVSVYRFVNDLILEGDELFNVSLTPHVPDVEVSPSFARTTVRIYGDADSKLYMIGYKKPSN